MQRFFTILFAVASSFAYGQQSTTVVQQIDIQLVNVIKMTFQNTGSNTGSTVNLALNNLNDLENGVTSTNNKLIVASTKPFNVAVKTNSNYFSYSGTNQTNNNMQVSDVLKLKLNQNQTGGSIANGFSSFKPLDGTDQDLIIGGDNGTNKKFRFKYRARPGLDYAAGVYMTDVIYTATQQ